MGGRYKHLLAAVDEPLLDRWNALLLFNAFFYLGDLGLRFESDHEYGGTVEESRWHLVLGLDVQFDLLTGKGTDSAKLLVGSSGVRADNMST